MINWPTKKLGEVCENCFSGVWGENPDNNGNVFVVRVSDVKDNGVLDYNNLPLRYVKEEKIPKYQLRDSDLVVVKSSGSKKKIISGKTAIFVQQKGKKVLASNFVLALRPNQKLVSPKWLLFYLNGDEVKEFIKKIIGITTYPNLKPQEYLNIEIPLPPLKIQKQIVTKIEELFEKIDKAKELRQKSQKETTEILQSALYQIFDKAEKKWEKKKLGDQQIANITSGGTPKRGIKKYYSKGTIPWLKSGELNDNENITDSEEHITKIALKESSAKIFPINTILIAMYGATVGKVGILKKPAATNQAIAGIKPSEEIIDYKFLFNYLIWKRNFLIWRSFGGAQPNISQAVIKKLEIPLPPLSEQKKIVAELDNLREKIDKLKVLQEQQAKELEELKKSILEKSFSGKLIKEKK